MRRPDVPDLPTVPPGDPRYPQAADETPAQADVGQIWEWRGTERPRDRFRVEFVGPETVALAIQRRPPDRRPAEVKRVTHTRLAAEYELVDRVPAKPVCGRRSGPIPRGNCPVCGVEHALRASGKPFRHHTLAQGRYSLGYCPGGER
jgi:hypothetical protein